MHNGFLNVDNEKMSKSLGNFFTIRDVLKRYDGETLRFFMLRTHYRSPFNFSDAHLDDARNALRRLYTALDGVDARRCRRSTGRAAGRGVPRGDERRLQHAGRGGGAVRPGRRGQPQRVRRRPRALLKALGATLGLLQQAPRSLPAGRQRRSTKRRIAERIAARARPRRRATSPRPTASATSWPAQGIVLKDSPQGTTWVKA